MEITSDEEGEDKLKDIINREFGKEIESKEEELSQIQQRIYETKKTLDILRYLAVTSYYSDGKSKETPHPSVKYLLGNVFEISPFTKYFISEKKEDRRKRKCVNSERNEEDDDVERNTQDNYNLDEEEQCSVEGNGAEESDDCSSEHSENGNGESSTESNGEHTVEGKYENSNNGNDEHSAEGKYENSNNGNDEHSAEGNCENSMERTSDLGVEVDVDYFGEESSNEEISVDDDLNSTIRDIHSYARTSCLSYKVKLKEFQLKRQNLEDEQENQNDDKVPRYIAPVPKLGTVDARGTKLQVKKQIVIGNLSKFLLPTESTGDKTTHKWMLYIRSKDEKEKLEEYVDKVILNLHPSYKPNDTVCLNAAPFHLVRRGWGEFPVRITMHFRNSRNKPIDVVHELRLDRTRVGLQTLGSETIIEVNLYE